MGQNSTTVAYGFGQMGSVYQNLARPVYPPKDHVIVAIQFIRSNILTALHTETLDSYGPQFVTTEDDELIGTGGPDANFAGVAWAAATGAGTVATGVIPIADVIANNAIKPGQIILIGDDAAEAIDAGIAIDVPAGHITPIYSGPNKRYLEVVSLTGGTYGTTLKVKEIGKTVASTGIANFAAIDSANQIYFLDSFHGAGGTTTEGTSYPTGIIIYGRWTMATPTADPDGGIICYFGH